MMHYCQGKWVKGERADCPEPVHNVKLVQTEASYNATLVRLGQHD